MTERIFYFWFGYTMGIAGITASCFLIWLYASFLFAVLGGGL